MIETCKSSLLKRNGSPFKTGNVRDTETLRYRGPKTWDIVPDDIKKIH